jgi:hypothetical protein
MIAEGKMLRQFAGRVRRPGAGWLASAIPPKRCSSISTSHPGGSKTGEDLEIGVFGSNVTSPARSADFHRLEARFFSISGRAGADLGTRLDSLARKTSAFWVLARPRSRSPSELSTAAPQLVLIAVWGNSSGSRDVGEHRPAPMSSTIRKLEDLPSDGGRTVDTLAGAAIRQAQRG